MDSFLKLNSPSMKKLLRWKQGDEESKWASFAEESLRKKVKKTKGAEEDLNYALTNPGQVSKCITIPRTSDGRLQIYLKKGLPHVVACRLWRWEDLQSHHELKSLDICQFPYSIKQKSICINPHHYCRVEHPVLPPVLVPPKSEFASERHLPTFSSNMFVSSMPGNVYHTENGFFHENSNCSTMSGSSNFDDSQGLLPENMAVDYSNMNLTGIPVHYEKPLYWSSIYYYEFNKRVGEAFNSSAPSIQVDGYTDPNNKNERFCLGILQNINRISVAESTRKLIGHGVRLTYVEGVVYAECLSDYPVFLQSRSLNRHHGFHPSTVCKLLSGNSLSIFNDLEFANLLYQTVNHGYAAVSELANLCTLRLSFAKGWGAEYRCRDATSTPCWIEITLHGPLQWHDKVLAQMGPPTGQISSMS